MGNTIKLPAEFEQRMQEQLQGDYDSFKQSLEENSPTSIRINDKKFNVENHGDACDNIPWSTNGYYLPKRPSFTLDPLFHAGGYYVQEASSMFLEQVIKQHAKLDTPQKVLDLCAAPGGKSTHLLSLFHPESMVIANEVIKSRSNILAENTSKWGRCNVLVSNNDPRDFESLPHYFDTIVIDAPCSGEGLFRKDPDAVNEWSTDNTQLCEERQQRILANIWESLKPGGLLVYSTCTYNPGENEQNMQWLQQQEELEFLPVETDNSWGVQPVSTDTGVIGYQFIPHHTKGEGFFICAVRKPDGIPQGGLKSKKSKVYQPDKQTNAELKKWIKCDFNYELVQEGDDVFMMPSLWYKEIYHLKRRLRLVKMGCKVCEIKKRNLNPTHELALSIYMNKANFPHYEATMEEAIKYLQKDVLKLPADAEKGLQTICYNSIPLGWIKNLGNRTNNLYPKEWRIRMTVTAEKLSQNNIWWKKN
ncbi:rRNA methyltransferase [Puteibacter caeruleilacunae]|nr:rRNA methyltransferase [Puteibacter caeruleilacunae]